MLDRFASNARGCFRAVRDVIEFPAVVIGMAAAVYAVSGVVYAILRLTGIIGGLR